MTKNWAKMVPDIMGRKSSQNLKKKAIYLRVQHSSSLDLLQYELVILNAIDQFFVGIVICFSRRSA